MWREGDLELRFAQFTQLLQAHQHWWRPRAFSSAELPWEREQPELSRLLRVMPLQQSEALAADNNRLAEFLSPWLDIARTLPALCELPQAALNPDVSSQKINREPRDVPGRKWQQILAFGAHLPNTQMPAVEWCSGKAHLGRWYVEQNNQHVDALEWNADLVAEGNRLSLREQTDVIIHHVDVLSPQSNNYLRADSQVLALHACGQLHIHLLQQCQSEHAPARVALAPCCYHLISSDVYQPLSAAAQAAQLPLTLHDLHTAVQESVTSPARVQKQRRQLQAWRLGFDLLQRDVRGLDEYMTTPSQPLSVLQNGFAAFCKSMATAKQLVLPNGLDISPYQHRGLQRLIEVNALDLPRLLFRRALELWLVLDRALYLREAGYDVTVGLFCERQLTPRNILITARRGH